jgi:hypothetical protein
MIRPVERFAVNIGGLPDPTDSKIAPPPPPRTGIGPAGLVAAACLGATLTLLAQRLLEDGRLLGHLLGLLRDLAG